VFAQDFGGPGSWGHFLKLRGSTMDLWDQFGAAVAVSQVGVALVGNPSQDNDGDNDSDGAAYVFAIDGPDCNLNGVPDDCDLSNGLADENRNGLPDGCESDCNDNDVIDAIEIADALWADCNGNGVPDDCDIAGGALIDVDGDGYPDACDPRDCNGNGVPDVTDIAEGSSLDCNGNFMIDGCEVAGGLAWDDGTAEIVLGGFGLDPQPLLWANPFDAGTASVISAVSVALYDDGEIAVGDPITVYLWSDPNNDGVPDDAVLLAQATSTIGVLSDLIGGPEAFNQVPITPTRVSGGFFAGAIVTTGDRPLMSDDVPYPLYKGWGIVGFDDPLALQMAPANPWGVWLVRAIALDSNDNGVPDGCDCLADVDRSGAVGIVDLLALLAAWGGSGPADIDGDGVVGPLDFTLLLSGWGPC
jgi:hypothetical protein